MKAESSSQTAREDKLDVERQKSIEDDIDQEGEEEQKKGEGLIKWEDERDEELQKSVEDEIDGGMQGIEKRKEKLTKIRVRDYLAKQYPLFNYLHLKEKIQKEKKEKQKERKRSESESIGYGIRFLFTIIQIQQCTVRL